MATTTAAGSFRRGSREKMRKDREREREAVGRERREKKTKGLKIIRAFLVNLI